MSPVSVIVPATSANVNMEQDASTQPIANISSSQPLPSTTNMEPEVEHAKNRSLTLQIFQIHHTIYIETSKFII